MKSARVPVYWVRPMHENAAHRIASWRYPPPYDIYNVTTPADSFARYLCDPQYDYHAVYEDGHESETNGPRLIGFCCYGVEAQVPGGGYEENALDIGIGLCPGLTGQGRGHLFVKRVLDYGLQRHKMPALRATVASFNKRSQRTFAHHGFRPTYQFQSTASPTRSFVIMVKRSL